MGLRGFRAPRGRVLCGQWEGVAAAVAAFRWALAVWADAREVGVAIRALFDARILAGTRGWEWNLAILTEIGWAAAGGQKRGKGILAFEAVLCDF